MQCASSTVTVTMQSPTYVTAQAKRALMHHIGRFHFIVYHSNALYHACIHFLLEVGHTEIIAMDLMQRNDSN